MTLREFTFKGMPYVIKKVGDVWYWREKDHLGGKCFPCEATIANPIRDPTFRRLMKEAINERD